MHHYLKKNNGMSLGKWYVDYLMPYTMQFKHPKYSKEQRDRYSEKLLEWYDNWDNSIQEEVKNGSE